MRPRLLALVCLLCLASSAAWSFTWNRTTVDSAVQSGFYARVRMDSVGNPHIGYLSRHTASLGIKHARLTSGHWSIETVDSTAIVGCGLSMAMGHDDMPRFSYYHYFDNGDPHAIFYTSYRNGAWTPQAVDWQASSDSSYNSLALDSADSPRLVYPLNTALQYATYNGSAWVLSSIPTPSAPAQPSIALDAGGKPFVSWGAQGLNCARLDGGTWSVDKIDTHGTWYTSIAVGSNGRPQIAYRDETIHAIKYAFFDGTSWHVETVAASSEVSSYTWLALDSFGNPSIAYKGDSNSLIYARRVGGVWTLDTVATNCSGYLSLAMSGSTAHIAYYSKSAALEYASAQVPEPSSAAVLAAGAALFCPLARRRFTGGLARIRIRTR
jgi:hypothetical protein